MADPIARLELPIIALNLPAIRARFRYRCRLGGGEHSMADPHTLATRTATSTLQPVPQRAFRLVCGYCGGNIAVESGSLAHHVRCPSCSHRVKVVRSVSRTCEYCGAQSSGDLTNGSMAAACNDCGRSFTVGPVVAPVLRRHQHGRRRSHPRSGADRAKAPAGVLLVVAIVILHVLVALSPGWLGLLTIEKTM